MRATRPLFQFQLRRPQRHNLRTFSSTPLRLRPQTRQGPTQPERPVNFYQVHGRAFAKVVTLSFLTYQITYWTWLLLETEAIRDEKDREIKSLEQEVRLLDEGRKGHKPGAG
ncbi:hypothetical protein A1O7_01343 [Cladophialophora yegresii CBS 114405]|uniref:Uncharacterized protein n=1 Tax=Cladophialophora yegresii CBS 114405 TaxID=1182544 RepID=W9X3E1_9EURO|nr:uncharacterized protein A1O7_01343 [Cladophialophora yegresii CBS 114405]EXJ65004.1 hypothetical protein A1O7_01343 [Cladophialophora yegresii CBS 114405]